MNSIKAVLFDLDGTLRFNLPSGGEVFTEQAIRLGLNITNEDKKRAARWEHYYFATSPELMADRERYKEDVESFWINYGRRRLVAMGCRSAQAEEMAGELTTYMRESYKPQVYIPDEAHTVLSCLKDSGLILGMISNRERSYEGELEEMGLKKYFQFALAGGEIPAYKPQPEIFLRALELAGVTGELSIYVGDNYFADVVGARRAGLKPVLYDPNEVFPEADCEVIKSFDELLHLL